MPFLGKTPTKLLDANVNIDGGNIDGTTIGATSTAPATVTTFTSTGIDDNATSTVLTIDSNNNVGIGTTSPTTLLELKSTTATAGLCITADNASTSDINLGDEDDVNIQRIRSDHSNNSLQFQTNNAERMRIDSAGNVGIGETSPDEILHVKESAQSVIKIESTSGSGCYLETTNTARSHYTGTQGSGNWQVYDNTAASARLVIDSSGNVGIGTSSPNTYGLGIGRIVSSYSSSGNLYALFSASGSGTGGGEIDFGNHTVRHAAIASLNGSDLAFYTNGTDSGVNVTERMRIDSSGFVGIGTSSPDRYLHVNASRSGDWLAEIHNTHTTNGYGLKVRAGDDANVTAMRVVDVSNNTLMEIQGGGNVGIGTTSPLYELSQHVSSSGANYHQFTNSTTGTGAGDGFLVGIGGDEEATLWNYENTHMRFATNSTEHMRISSAGTLNVGTTAASGTSGNTGIGLTQIGRMISNCDADWNYEIYGAQGNRLRFFGSQGGGTQVGSITVTTSATAYNTTSDQRLKENIVDAPAGNIDAIRVRSFDWKTDGSHQTYGMVAQELVDVAPEAVSQGGTEDDMWSVDYSKLVPMMIKEIQDLKAEVAALKGA